MPDNDLVGGLVRKALIQATSLHRGLFEQSLRTISSPDGN